MPGGAVPVTRRVAEPVQAAGGFQHGFTCSHHPVVAAAGLAVLRYVERHDLVARAAATGEYLLARLRGLGDIPTVGDVGGQADGRGDLVMLGAPLAIEREQVDEAVAILGDAITAITRGR